jgi:NAD(P)-dependent dehydrogenase (short-subunit alcohol dehydrogenase family)
VEAAVAEVLARAGRIDAIVNNAGVDLLGAVEETTTDEALNLFQTNFFGVHRLVRAVLPTMRSQKSGRIVTIGSIAGFLPTPFETFYSAAKHALEGYCESLSYEVRPFNIHTVLIEPGFIRTSLRANLTRTRTIVDAYSERRERAGSGFDQGVESGIDPVRVAQAVGSALTLRRPNLHMRVGRDAHQLHFIYNWMPEFIFAQGMRQRFG